MIWHSRKNKDGNWESNWIKVSHRFARLYGGRMLGPFYYAKTKKPFFCFDRVGKHLTAEEIRWRCVNLKRAFDENGNFYPEVWAARQSYLKKRGRLLTLREFCEGNKR